MHIMLLAVQKIFHMHGRDGLQFPQRSSAWIHMQRGCQLGLNLILACKCHWHGAASGLRALPEGEWLRLNFGVSCGYSALQLVEIHIRPA